MSLVRHHLKTFFQPSLNHSSRLSPTLRPTQSLLVTVRLSSLHFAPDMLFRFGFLQFCPPTNHFTNSHFPKRHIICKSHNVTAVASCFIHIFPLPAVVCLVPPSVHYDFWCHCRMSRQSSIVLLGGYNDGWICGRYCKTHSRVSSLAGHRSEVKSVNTTSRNNDRITITVQGMHTAFPSITSSNGGHTATAGAPSPVLRHTASY